MEEHITVTTVVTVLSSIVALIASVVSVIRSYKLTPKEAAREDAVASETYAKAAVLSEQRAQEFGKRLDALDADFKVLSVRHDRALNVLAEWARGIELLLYQMKNAHLTAVWLPNPKDVLEYKEREDNSHDEASETGAPPPVKRRTTRAKKP